jgi:hypothetical protein
MAATTVFVTSGFFLKETSRQQGAFPERLETVVAVLFGAAPGASGGDLQDVLSLQGSPLMKNTVVATIDKHIQMHTNCTFIY